MPVQRSFRLVAFLRADLRQQRRLLSGNEIDVRDGFALWLGMLSPRFLPVLLCRLAHWSSLRGLGPLAKVFSLLNFLLFGIEIASRCPIGPGLFFPHPQGTVIGAWAIGSRATIFQGVTLGAKELDFSYSEGSRPVLGDGVTVGAGAKVLGGVMLGDGVCVGANAVVIESAPAGALLVGVPARVLHRGVTECRH